ncbi:alpha/beta hydrolase [Myxococcus sp. K15C18031901]|uniref:esterase/lipase family protein n=1 Tax=Myxococcus dinghuensis TaxID=2906761 RepID=UPI0020A76C1E|nr:alpha/beta hydrolase [Myxococcus dinghuensis]MCP3102104.1 alpha/beta hydrolase [Myxococcus dinghuensis]
MMASEASEGPGSEPESARLESPSADSTAVPARVKSPGGGVDFALGVLNGVLGDSLHRRRNTLAIPMGFHLEGQQVVVEREALRAAYPQSTGRLAVWVHGLAVTEAIWAFPTEPLVNYGALLKRDAGITPLYLRYNTGLHISDNGEQLAHLLEQLVTEFPVPVTELVLFGYSMGGLVLRGACHVAQERGFSWLSHVRRSFSIGVPHLGSPLERVGNVIAQVLRVLPSPYAQLIADVADLRSDGIKDLGSGRWRRQDWAAPRDTGVPPPAPHPPGIVHHLIVGALGQEESHALSAFLGDGVVPLSSAAGRARHVDAEPLFPQENVSVVTGIDHVSLAHHLDVYARIRACFETEAA